MRNFLMILIGAGLISGCATEIMSEKECLAGDWYGAGLDDGSEGRLASAYDERAAQCTNFGVAADASLYVEGREAALRQLCTEEGGYAYGRGGRHYLGVCRAELEAGFLGGYLSGRRIFALESERNRLQAAYDEAAGASDYQARAIDQARYVLDDPAATPEEREAASTDLDYAIRTKRRADRDLEAALYELGRADEALDQAISSQAEWRNSERLELYVQTLLETHQFARNEEAIDYCTDDLLSYTPKCAVRTGATLRDSQSDKVCAVGPGEARIKTTGPHQGSHRSDLFEHGYYFFPGEEGSGRFTNRPSATFLVLFEGESRTYVGVSCPPGYLGQ